MRISFLPSAFLDGRTACPSTEGRASLVGVILFYRMLQVLMRTVYTVTYIEMYLVVLVYCGMGPVLACKGTGFVLRPGMQLQEVRMGHRWSPFAKTSPCTQLLLDKAQGSAAGDRHHPQGILQLML